MADNSGWRTTANSPTFADTQPAVTGQAYQPYDQGPCSWPGTTVPGYVHQKQGGHIIPRFGPGSQGSSFADVDHPAEDYDVFRDAKSQWGRAGPPDSKYEKDYHQYKDAEPQANKATDAYTTHKRKATRYTGQEVNDNSDTVGGKPLETQDWHQHAASLADDAAQACQRVSHLRSEYNSNYVGYHQPHYRDGHREARDNFDRRANTFSGYADAHRNWQSLADRIAQGRAKKEASRAVEDVGKNLLLYRNS